jgi:excisionase family DNA binding protein
MPDEIDLTREKLYTSKEVAVIFGVSMWTIRQWVTQGKLQARKQNNQLRFTDKQINDYANKRYGDK